MLDRSVIELDISCSSIAVQQFELSVVVQFETQPTRALGRPRSAACQHVVCRAQQSFDQDGQPSYDEAHKCLFKEGRKPRAHDGDFMHYNFVRIHQTSKVTPAMAAGVTPKLWEMSDMVKVLEAWEATK